MANYMATFRTNYFRVTDENKYKELFEKLSGEDVVQDFSYTDDNGNILHGFGCYGCIGYYNEDEEYDLDLFFEELQEILPDDDAMIWIKAEYEKLRYVIGSAIVVTKDDIQSMDINTWAVHTARKMLKNENFKTKLEY